MQIIREGGFGFWNGDTESWDVELSSDVEYDLELNYGAVEADLDLSGLQVENLDMDIGVTGTEIKFARYPTDVVISTGASSIDMRFPEGYPVRIEVDSGITSIELSGFSKKDDVYFSPGFDDELEPITIEIDAGVSCITGSFY